MKRHNSFLSTCAFVPIAIRLPTQQPPTDSGEQTQLRDYSAGTESQPLFPPWLLGAPSQGGEATPACGGLKNSPSSSWALRTPIAGGGGTPGEAGTESQPLFPLWL